MLQDRKYEFREGYIINRASGEVIPLDEPVFLFRARDVIAVRVLEFYHSQTPDDEHRQAINIRINDFEGFARQFPERMKEPDTDITSSDWE